MDPSDAMQSKDRLFFVDNIPMNRPIRSLTWQIFFFFVFLFSEVEQLHFKRNS